MPFWKKKNQDPDPAPVTHEPLDVPVPTTVDERASIPVQPMQEAQPMQDPGPATGLVVEEALAGRADAGEPPSADPEGAEAEGDGAPAGKEPFVPELDTEPVPPGLTLAVMSSIIKNDTGIMYVAIHGDAGPGRPYGVADALLRYGNCRVREVDSAMLDGSPVPVYRIAPRPDPVSDRLERNPNPLPFDVPCWRPGHHARLRVGLPSADDAPASEIVECVVTGGTPTGDGGPALVSIRTRDGMELEGIRSDCLFLPGVPVDQADRYRPAAELVDILESSRDAD